MIAMIARAILSWFGGAAVALFGGWKLLLLTTFMAFLGVYFYNLVSGILQELLAFVTSQASSVGSIPGQAQTYAFTGFAGYMLSVLKIPECMAFIISVITIKFLMRKIPIIKW